MVNYATFFFYPGYKKNSINVVKTASFIKFATFTTPVY